MSDYGLERGAAELQSIGPIAFGPGDVLLVGDNGAASIVAAVPRMPARPPSARPRRVPTQLRQHRGHCRILRDGRQRRIDGHRH